MAPASAVCWRPGRSADFLSPGAAGPDSPSRAFSSPTPSSWSSCDDVEWIMSEAALDPRLRQVLLAVIAEYVETAQPVGSRSVARRHVRGLSPATIRNAMADLEDMGFLTHPHTSAGRVPTDKAYRFYVNVLGEVPWKAASGGQKTAEAAPPSADGAERLMAETPTRLSDGTHMTGILLAPPLRRTALDRIELVGLGEDRALAVAVRAGGGVRARAPPPMPPPSVEELGGAGRTLPRRYRGKTF